MSAKKSFLITLELRCHEL